MATKFNESTQQVVTVDEAAAIAELWEKRKREAEGLYSGLSIRDVAETMAIPESEVEIMLRLVRNSPDAEEQIKQERIKKRRRRILITGAVVAWLTILAAAFAVTYSLGQRNNRIAYNPGYSAYTGDGMLLTLDNGTLNQSQNIEEYIPEKLNIEFQGYAVDGTSTMKSLKEDNLEYALNEVIRKVLPRTSSYAGSYPNPDLTRALQSGELGQFVNTVRFDEIVAKVGGKTISAKIPVNISGDNLYQSAINNDMRRRLRIFANQAWRLSKGKDVAAPSGAAKTR